MLPQALEDAPEGEQHSVFDALMALLTHRDGAARAGAMATVRRLLRCYPPLARRLLGSFERLLRRWPTSLVGDAEPAGSGYAMPDIEAAAEAMASAEARMQPRFVNGGVLSTALLLATHTLPVAEASALLLPAHHPALCGAARVRFLERRR